MLTLSGNVGELMYSLCQGPHLQWANCVGGRLYALCQRPHRQWCQVQGDACMHCVRGHTGSGAKCRRTLVCTVSETTQAVEPDEIKILAEEQPNKPDKYDQSFLSPPNWVQLTGQFRTSVLSFRSQNLIFLPPFCSTGLGSQSGVLKDFMIKLYLGYRNILIKNLNY